MGISKEQLVNALGISKEYSDTELSELERRVNTLVQSLYDVIANGDDNEINVVDKASGLQDTPVGHIMAYMGNTAPDHYLICDGSILAIADYPLLSQHFLKEFGSVSYFGGDGTTTFALPDLRGEFLRGAGTADRNSGNGANVGEHQDATAIPYEGIQDTTLPIMVYPNQWKTMSNFDSIISTSNLAIGSQRSSRQVISTGVPSFVTVRPTNASVLWCIKANPTYFIQVNNNTFASQKMDVIFDQTPVLNKEYTLPAIPKDNFNALDISIRCTVDNPVSAHSNRLCFSERYYIDNELNGAIRFSVGGSFRDAVWSYVQGDISGNSMVITEFSQQNVNPIRLIIRGIRFAKMQES